MTELTQNKIYSQDFSHRPVLSSSDSLPFFHNNGGERRHCEGDEQASIPLPCLYSNNSIEITQTSSDDHKKQCVEAVALTLTPYHKRQAQTLFLNVERLITKVAQSPNHVGFLTLTFPDNVTDFREASRRFNSLKTNFLSKYPEFGEWICVKEQQKRGAWHFHLVVCLSGDIKSGLNFEELARGVYKSASPYLRGIWSDLREAMPKYKFGRSELLPIKSSAEAMARYVGKYISKHIGQREPDNKGVRLISTSRGWAKNSVRFGWNTDNAKLWRKKLRIFAMNHGCEEMYQLSEKLGPGWAYKYADDIDNAFSSIDLAARMKDREHKSNTIKAIEINQEKKEKYLKEKLTLHIKKPKYAETKEKAKQKISLIKNEDNFLTWLKKRYEAKKEQEEISSLQRPIVAEKNIQKLPNKPPIDRELYSEHGELIPF
jgi:hypothetical protein